MKNFFHPVVVAALIACSVSNAFAEELGVEEQLAQELIELTTPDDVLVCPATHCVTYSESESV